VNFTVDQLSRGGCRSVELDEPVWMLPDELSDGLPCVPPTEDRVEAMVAAGGREPDRVIGHIPQRRRTATVLQAAVCAVMAGADPSYFPVILASWDALLDPAYRPQTCLATTGGPAITGIVSGSFGEQIGMNSGTGLLGPGNRANATIGRALRLGAISVLGSSVGVLDASSFSHGGKYTSHFLESTPPGTWRPLRVQEGFSEQDTTVTLVPTDGPRQIHQSGSAHPEPLLRTLAAAMRDPSHLGTGRMNHYVVVIGPEHAQVLSDAGLSTAEVTEALSRWSQATTADFERAGAASPAEPGQVSRDGFPPTAGGDFVSAPVEKIRVVTAGGNGPGWSVVLPGWAGGPYGQFVTKRVTYLQEKAES
jgi:hypothetical protein